MATKTKKRKRKKQAEAPRRRKKLSRLQVALIILIGLGIALFMMRATFFANAAHKSIARRDLDRAKSQLTWGTYFARNNGRLQFLLARVARLEGRMKDVQHHLQAALDAGFDQERLRREEYLAMAQLGQLKQAQPHLGKLLEDPRGDEEEICEAYVIGFTRIRHFAAAKDLLENWMKDFPNSARPRYLKGIVQKDLQMWNEAATAFRDALRADPNHHDSQFELGSVLLTRKRPEEALTYFVLAAQGKNHKQEAKVAQAHCMRLLARHNEARQVLSSVLTESPGHEDASLEMARLELDGNNYDRVVELLQEVVKNNPRGTDARLVIAQALRSLGKHAEAEAHIKAVAEANNHLMQANEWAEKVGNDLKSAEKRSEIGKIHLKYGSREEGLMWLMGAFQVNPKHRPTLEALVDYYGKNGDAENMQTFLRHLEQLK